MNQQFKRERERELCSLKKEGRGKKLQSSERGDDRASGLNHCLPKHFSLCINFYLISKRALTFFTPQFSDMYYETNEQSTIQLLILHIGKILQPNFNPFLKLFTPCWPWQEEEIVFQTTHAFTGLLCDSPGLLPISPWLDSISEFAVLLFWLRRSCKRIVH